MLSIPGAAQTAIASGMVPLCPLIYMDLSSDLRLALAGVNLVYGGYTWTGVGLVGEMDSITDSTGDRKGVQFSLSSVPTELLAIALAEPMQGKRVTVDLAICDPATFAVVGVIRQFTGTLGQPEISESDGSGRIVVTAESRGEVMNRPRVVRYIDSDQQRLYPGDTSLRFITSQAQHQDIWPSAKWGRQ